MYPSFCNVSHFLSLTPGFSRVEIRRARETVLTVSRSVLAKPLKRLCDSTALDTGLKPGANERLPEIEMRTIPALCAFASWRLCVKTLPSERCQSNS
jgi:hypothetical protein